MESQSSRQYLFALSLWLVDAYLIGRSVLEGAHVHVWLVLLFAILIFLLTMLRVKVGRVMRSAVALITYLSITSVGPSLAAALQLSGVFAVAIGQYDEGRLRKCVRWLVDDAPVFMTATLCAGWAYKVAGGVIGGMPPRTWVLPFLAMAATAVASNLLLLGCMQGYARRKNPLRLAIDLFGQGWLSGSIYIVVGVGLQALYYEIGVLGLPLIVVLLLLLRMIVGLQAENQGVRSEMASTLAQMLAMRDPYTGEHSQRVAAIAVATGRELGLSDAQLERLHDSALVHDIGKVAVPDAVLRKPGPLDAGERTSMDVHVTAGGELLEHSPHLRDLAPYVRSHHVHAGPESTAQPLEARIIAVADAFDAMTTDRPYRAALPLHEAVRRLRAGVGTQFDGQVVDALVRALGRANPAGAAAFAAEQGWSAPGIHDPSARTASDRPPAPPPRADEPPPRAADA